MPSVRFFRSERVRRHDRLHRQDKDNSEKRGPGAEGTSTGDETEAESEEAQRKTLGEIGEELYYACLSHGMLPTDWGHQTYGENLDWLNAANEREAASYERIKVEAWHYGVAFHAAYAAAWSNQSPYPKSPAEMFKPSDGEHIPSDLSEEEVRARQERMWDLEMNRMAAGLEIAAARQQADQA